MTNYIMNEQLFMSHENQNNEQWLVGWLDGSLGIMSCHSNHRLKINGTLYGNPFLEANISATKTPTKEFDLPPNLFFRQTLVEKFHAIKAGFSSCSPPKFLRLKGCYSCLSLLFVTRVSSFKILINPFKAYF